MASTQDVNMDGSLAGCEAFGSRTTMLSVHSEEETAMLPITVGGSKPSGRRGAGAARGTVRVNLGVDEDDNGNENLVECGVVSAEAGGWTELMGAFRLRTEPRSAAIYVHGAPAGVDVKVMDLRVFQTDRKARFRQLRDKTDKARKRDVVLKLGAATGAASVRVVQMDSAFPFGTCINTTVIQNPAFVDFFTNHMDWAVFENELKWYHTEAQQGQLNYRDADALLDFCDRLGKRARGHCIFWSADGAVQQWVKNLDRDQLRSAVQSRIQGLVSRYAGRFPHYDVNNEMLHGRFFRDRLGDEDVPAFMFKEVARLDPDAALFVNDYNVECANDPNATPDKYAEQVAWLQSCGAVVRGIGLQGHVSNPVGEVVCGALDRLAATGVPIWFTELDVCEPDVGLRAQDLEVVLREAYAHPAPSTRQARRSSISRRSGRRTRAEASTAMGTSSSGASMADTSWRLLPRRGSRCSRPSPWRKGTTPLSSWIWPTPD
uniref:Endo-1,4-beta-xylanase C n=1 Tax=Aegilops tauschii TaxID=37682 RepID=M8CG38_AEGTA